MVFTEIEEELDDCGEIFRTGIRLVASAKKRRERESKNVNLGSGKQFTL